MEQLGKRYKLETDYPIAVNSPDHYSPYGIKENNSHWQEYNDKLYQLFPKPIRLCDFGPAGGRSVYEFNMQGNLACGLEGSDYRKVRNMPEWHIEQDLFTCDLTKDFEIYEIGGAKAQFDVIQAFEFLEHISIHDIQTIYGHVKRLLKPGGAWIVSISVYPTEMAISTEGQHWGDSSKFPGMGLCHQLVRPIEDWDTELIANGFKLNNEKLAHFEGHFVRAPGRGCPVEYTFNRYIEIQL